MVAAQATTESLSSKALPVVGPDGAVAVSVDTLHPYHCGVVIEIEAPDDDADRLKAMGVCVGRKVELIQRGDPLILRVLGSRIGLSARLARRIKVLACEAVACSGTSG
ncbi:MAG: ferrous iron transport protein A [Phycisphaeraceae bacterium]|nr:ferrous iron transport protein A [Phycisphaeraceae bacterium]